jgi:5-methylcytosine-specific restriction protein A
MDFVVGEIYRRRDIHRVYGGQMQGGISTPRSFPMIFLFTGDSGRLYGYEDTFRDNGTFSYTGEGRSGPMKMEKGNRAIRDHLKQGKTLHLFVQASRGFVRYEGEATYLDDHLEPRIDVEGNLRSAIVFELFVESGGSGKPINSAGESSRDPDARLWAKSLDELRAMATQNLGHAVTTTERKRIVYERSKAVRIYVLRRANGVCEGCGSPAPFKTTAGRPYLEPHHIRRVADMGPDHPGWMAALCPNCHRRVHHGEDGTRFNESLVKRVQG